MTTDGRDFVSLTVDREDHVACITLDRPAILNRFDDALHGELAEALRRLADATEVRAVILASTGPVFSAGGDFDVLRACHADRVIAARVVADGRRLLDALIGLPQPIIAALHGDAVGVAATVALACDAVVAAKSVRIIDPHVRVGLVAGDGGCLVWPQAAGMLRAKRHLLTGDPLGAADAAAMGLVTDLVNEPCEVRPAARRLAAQLAALPPLAVQGTKRTLNQALAARGSEVVGLGFAYEAETMRSDDLLEAIDAFKDRRAPEFHGR